MNDDLSRGPSEEPGGELGAHDIAAISAALRRLGEQHDPDTEGIWARIDPSRTGADDVVRLDGRRDRHPRYDGGRSRRPWVAAGLAAASVLGVLFAAQTFVVDHAEQAGQPLSQSPSVTVSTATSGPTSPEPTQEPTRVIGGATATSVPPTGGRSTAAAGSSTSSAPPAGSSTTDPVPPVPSPAQPTTVNRVTVAPAGEADLEASLGTSPSGFLDWIVPNRGDGTLLRAKRPVGGPGFDVTAPPKSVATSSPYRTNWVDGLPEQTGTTTAWFVAQPGGSWQITVHGASVDRWLVVRVGNSLGANVSVQGPDWSGAGKGFADGPKIVTVRIPATGGTTTVTLTGDVEDGLAIASVTLQKA